MGESEKICAEWRKSVKRPQFGRANEAGKQKPVRAEDENMGKAQPKQKQAVGKTLTAKASPASTKSIPAKQIFVLYGPAKQGKTPTINNITKILDTNYPNCIIYPKKKKLPKDGRVIMKINDISVGIVSRGDPSAHDKLKKVLDDFKNKGCVIIFCAARTNHKDSDKILGLINSYLGDYDVNYIRQICINNKQQEDQTNRTVALYIISILLPRLVYEKLI
jgi:hypothetical protein